MTSRLTCTSYTHIKRVQDHYSKLYGNDPDVTHLVATMLFHIKKSKSAGFQRYPGSHTHLTHISKASEITPQQGTEATLASCISSSPCLSTPRNQSQQDSNDVQTHIHIVHTYQKRPRSVLNKVLKRPWRSCISSPPCGSIPRNQTQQDSNDIQTHIHIVHTYQKRPRSHFNKVLKRP